MLEKLKAIAKLLKTELKVYQLVLKDERTPFFARILLWIAMGYVLLPFDLIPDFIPLIGHLDDAVIVPLLIFLALKLIPEKVIENCREKVVHS
ncbi:DUF1232 domain-containing protein [bacterium]|nr:DUF1232 domain-containing protein [bacterium]